MSKPWTPKIEKGIPVPLWRGNNKGYTASIRALKKGGSVFLPITQLGSIRTTTGMSKKTHVTRPEGKGTRIWKIT